MASENGDRDAARRAAEEVFREKVGIWIRSVGFALAAILGLNVAASSSNVPSIVLMPVGVLAGLGIILLSICGILRLHGVLS